VRGRLHSALSTPRFTKAFPLRSCNLFRAHTQASVADAKSELFGARATHQSPAGKSKNGSLDERHRARPNWVDIDAIDLDLVAVMTQFWLTHMADRRTDGRADDVHSRPERRLSAVTRWIVVPASFTRQADTKRNETISYLES